MIFRAFFGEPVPEARELEHGHLRHADVPTNPMTGEVEDTDVGFPGPGHYIAEREVPMKVAMGALAVLAVIARRRCRSRASTTSSRSSSSPTFADSKFANVEPSHRIGLARARDRRRDRGRRASRSPTAIWVVAPGTVDPRCASASRRIYTLPFAQVVLR